MQPDEYNPLPPDAHAFLDGRLAPEAEADFRRRMDADPVLRTGVEKLHRALNLLKTLPARDPGPQFNDRVMGRVRESELIERARRRIVGARAPVWQPFAWAAAGAVAAALVLTLAGVFGAASLDPAPGQIDLAAAPTEDDLLPALADQYQRYRRLSTHVTGLQDADGAAQRQLLRVELELADLQRRGQWLGSQLAALSLERRREYQQFLDALAGAVDLAEHELARGGEDTLDLSRISAALRAVRAPQSVGVRAGMERAGSRVTGRRLAAPESWSEEVRAYAAEREALYGGGDKRILAACEAYLRPFGRGGRFVKDARLIEVASLVRVGRPGDAALRMELTFGPFAEKLEPRHSLWLEEQLTGPELEQLQAARAALRDGDE